MMEKRLTLLFSACALLLFAMGREAKSQTVTLSARQAQGQVLVQISGPAGARGTLHTSADLRSWAPFQDFTLANGTAAISVPSSAGIRFYSARQSGPIVTLPDLAALPNSVFTPGEGFDTAQYAPDGKLGFIVWKNGSLVLRERSTAGSWAESTVTTGGPAFDLSPKLRYTPQPAAVLLYDSSSQAHVFKANASAVQHFSKNGGSWTQASTINAPGAISRFVAGIGRDNSFHLGLHVGGSLVYANSRNSWSWTNVDSAQQDPSWMPGSYSRRWLSLAIDSKGAAHFVYRPAFDFSRHPEGYMRAYTKLKYASNRSGAWASQTIREPDDNSGEAGSGQSVAIGPNDLPVIASWYNERGDGGSSQWSRLQFYEMNSSGQWSRSEVASRPISYIAGDGEKGTGASPYVRFDLQGRPHIVFTDHAAELYGQDCRDALAAAFISFLWSRTFCSDAPSTTSATERYPSSA